MKIVSARIPDELFNALEQFCAENGSNINKVVAQAILAAIKGKVELKPLGAKDICPRCGHTTHLIQSNSKLYFVCLNCDWAGYLGEYSLPSQIEDLTEKSLEED